MEIMMTHFVYFFFHLISSISPHLVGLHIYSKLTQEKTLAPITRIGRFVRSKKSYEWKTYVEPCLQLFKKIVSGQFEKRRQVKKSLCHEQEVQI